MELWKTKKILNKGILMDNLNIIELPTRKYLLECFIYNPETGDLVWKKRPISHFRNEHVMKVWNSKHSNKIAGTKVSGYINILIDKVAYRSHRLIWKIIYGEDPNKLIDHINGIRDDNRIENLRLATYSENSRNINKLTKSNSTGFTGIHYSKRDKRYVVQVRNNTADDRYIGRYYTLEAAIYYREKAAKEQYGDFYTTIEENRDYINTIICIPESDIIKLEEDFIKKIKNSKNKLGVCGVKQTPAGKYSVEIRYKRQYYYVGVFNTLEEASIARENKLKELKSLEEQSNQ